MQSKKTAILAIVMAFVLLSFVACSNRDEQNSVAPSTSNAPSSQSEPTPPPSSNESSSSGASTVPPEEREYFTDLSAEDEALYQVLTGERGLQEWQIHSLFSHGFSFENMIELTDEMIASLLAPGGSYMGDYMEEGEINSLVEGGMSKEDALVLMNLGYDYNAALALTPEQLDFIFPNIELVDNLVALGYDRSIVQAAGFLSVEGGYDTYKDLLDEVFAKYPNGKK